MMTCMICLKYMSNKSIYCESLTKNKNKKQQQKKKKTKKQKKIKRNEGTHTHLSHKIADKNHSNMNNKK